MIFIYRLKIMRLPRSTALVDKHLMPEFGAMAGTRLALLLYLASDAQTEVLGGVAAANGIADSTFQARISIHGWDPEEAATTPPHPRPYELAAIKNRKIPREIYELAVANGISESTFRSRIYESGWDVRRAATEPLWTHEQVCAYGNARIKKKYGDNPMGHLFPHREKR
ncbi:hypothetical protein [Cohnella cellulosilytica]|uniref:hypothetical protein n=1 Tax=Cohnella cellulosilytica TaxID=986710 RepID=UPI00360D8CAB